uniref:Uncharacterized protein n=1 Tax=Romanomermis culicivorax TaxID=13658 RepID=A0A915JNH0_ROMCU
MIVRDAIGNLVFDRRINIPRRLATFSLRIFVRLKIRFGNDHHLFFGDTTLRQHLLRFDENGRLYRNDAKRIDISSLNKNLKIWIIDNPSRSRSSVYIYIFTQGLFLRFSLLLILSTNASSLEV